MISVSKYSPKEGGGLREVSISGRQGSIPVAIRYVFRANGSPMLHQKLIDGIPVEIIYIHKGEVKIEEYRRTGSGGSPLTDVLAYKTRACIYDRKGNLTLGGYYDDIGRRHGNWLEYSIKLQMVYRQYYHHGVALPDEEYVNHPEKITEEAILSTGNVETRRALLDLMGTENFLLKLRNEILSEQGNDSLYRVFIGQEYFHMVKFVCPSTGDIYFHFVPANIMEIGEAKCWMFGIKGKEFTPIEEA